MNTLMRLAAAGLLIAAGSGAFARAHAVSCASINATFSGSGILTRGYVDVLPGDTVVVTENVASQIATDITEYQNGVSVRNVYLVNTNAAPFNPPPHTYVAPANVDQIFLYVYVYSGSASVTCTPALTSPPATTAKAAPQGVAETASILSANSQTRAMGTGLRNNAQSRLGGGAGNLATQGRLFFSTQNLARSRFETPELNFWISAEARNYNGGFDGYSADVVVGGDRMFSENFLAGLMLAFGRTDIEGTTGDAVIDSPALGAYFATRFSSGLTLDGYVAYARPEYDTDGTSFSSDRLSVDLSLAGEYRTTGASVRPFLRVSGHSEDQPAYTGVSGAVPANEVSSYTASLGARLDSDFSFGAGALKPYFSAAVDYGYSESTTNGTDDFVYPRLGIGLSGPVGAGHLSIDLDGGRVTSDTYDVGLQANYEFNF